MNTLLQPVAGRNTSTEESRDGSSPRLSRSPHPYHRRSGSLILHKIEPPTSKHEAPSRSESTESGTEADDEKGHLLKSLPPPPVRARKGLRGASPRNLTPGTSPLPTPSAFIGQDATIFFGPRAYLERPDTTEESNEQKRNAYVRRKKRELLRRTTELALLLAIWYLTWTVATKSQRLRLWTPELTGFAAIPPIFFALHPILRSINAYASGRQALRAFYTGFHIPSRFDSGTLIYPTLVPLMVALTLFGHDTTYLPVNITCGLASLPQVVFAPWPDEDFASYVHWIATVLPFHISTLRQVLEVRSLPFGLKANSSLIAASDLTLLFPLHRALNETLEYLTTTSLDPSERQLLSTALVNLWLFAESPQAQILKAALWVGGLSIFVTCGQLLTWEVELARIPKWRFSRQRSTLSLATRARRALAVFYEHDKTQVDSSDDEVDIRARRLIRIRTVAETQTSSAHSSLIAKNVNGSASNRSRRNTFSALDQQTKETAERKSKPTRPTAAVPLSLFLRLTYQQAKLRKYAYAAMVYSFVLLIILLPVFSYISRHALGGHNPIGWAIGYALGDLEPVQHVILSSGLDFWIALPPIQQELHGSPTARVLTDRPLSANIRALVCVYCLTVLAIGVSIAISLTTYVEVDTRRKVFHGVMVVMLFPTIFVDPCFLSLALTIILAVFLLLDLFRASQLPPISRPLTNFLAPYTDGRDHRGPVIVSHIFLLIGCAIPLWLSLAGVGRIGKDPWRDWDTPYRDIGMISGVVCVGMGDAAASLIGRRFGRTKWYWGGGKSLEGSLAFAFAVTVGLFTGCLWLRVGGWTSWDDSLSWILIKCAIAGAGSSLLESVLTAANDNVVVPIGLWLLVKGLQI